jgi:hypothetical protein
MVRAGNGQAQIALKGLPGGTKKEKTWLLIEVEGDEYSIVVGDTYVAWASHQDDQSAESFERLFALLADSPDRSITVTKVSKREHVPWSTPSERY